MRRDPWPNRHTEECTGCGALRGELHYSDCRGHLGTGIRNHDAARNDLRRRFGQQPVVQPVRRPGMRFYVTALSDDRMRRAFLLGPYVSHMTAIAAMPRAWRELTARYDPNGFSVGTASLARTVPTKFGR